MQNEARGLAAIYTSMVLFSFAAVTVKYTVFYVNGITISFFRFAIGLVLGIAMLKALRMNTRLYKKRALLLRGLFGATAMILFYLSIQYNSSGRATLLAATYPLFVALIGATLFRERILALQWLSLGLCLAGIALVFNDKSSYSLTGDLLAVCSAVSSGFAIHFVKKARAKNNTTVIYLSVCVCGMLFSLPLIPGDFTAVIKMPAPALIAAIALLTFSGHIFMGYGYKYTSASRGSIAGFTEIILTLFLSRLLLHEQMNLRFLLGALCIIAGLINNIIPFLKDLRNRPVGIDETGKIIEPVN